MDQHDSKHTGLSVIGTLKHLSSSCVDDDEGENENVDHVDFNANYSCTLDEEVGFPMPMEKVTEKNMKMTIGVWWNVVHDLMIVYF